MTAARTALLPLGILTLLVSSARADAPPSYHTLPPSPPPAAPDEVHWYGWKIALSDAAAVSLVLAAIALDSPEPEDPDSFTISGTDALVIVGMGWWTTMTPLLHLTDRNLVGAGMSYGLRLGLPLAGALIGMQLDGPASPDDPYAGGGLLIGAIAATAIDIAWVAKRSNRQRHGIAWPLPQFAIARGGVQLGLAGAF